MRNHSNPHPFKIPDETIIPRSIASLDKRECRFNTIYKAIGLA
jgi:hypothetical protein